MRLPSIEQLIRSGRTSAGRFPFVLLSGAVAAATGVLMPDSSIDEEILQGILYVATLGIPLFLAIDLVAERQRASARAVWIARVVGIAFLVGIYVARPTWSDPVQVFRYVQLSVAAHLLVAVAPYASVREWNGFWQYNRTLLLRFLLGAVFSVVLYFGLSIALLAIDNLLGVEVEPETYFRLWCVIAFLFNTWFFLAGIPEGFEALERRTDYPPVLKVFAQYILSPLVAVYLVILTVYLGRILVTRVWPSGWIGYLVSSVAAAGILSLLLLYPIAEKQENAWVRRYARWFFVGLIPADAMLLLAIWKRIDQYAITEPRYFLVVLSLWLGGISLFYAITRSRNIKVIPATLVALALVTFAGPWSAYATSERSQAGRLEGILNRNGMLENGRVRPPAADVGFDDRREIAAVLRYLARTHGTASIEGWFPEGRLAEADTLAPVTRASERGTADERAALITAELGVEYVGSWAPGRGEDFQFSPDPGGPPVRITGLDYAIRNRDFARDTIRLEEPPVEFVWNEDRMAVEMRVEGAPALSASLGEVLEEAIEATRRQTAGGALPAAIFTVEARGNGARLVLAVTALGGEIESEVAGEGEASDEGEGPGAGAYRITRLFADAYFTLAPD